MLWCPPASNQTGKIWMRKLLSEVQSLGLHYTQLPKAVNYPYNQELGHH